MEWASLGVAILALLGAGWSLRYARRADGRAERAEDRAERAEARSIRDESRAERREEREARAEVERRSGLPLVTPGGIEGGPTADPVVHHYVVRNGGAATISQVWLWIEDAAGNAVSNRAGGPIVIHPTVSKAAVDVAVRQPLPDTEQTLMVEWTDVEGTHGPESTGLHPPRSA